MHMLPAQIWPFPQGFPQPPQFCASFCVFTHCPALPFLQYVCCVPPVVGHEHWPPMQVDPSWHVVPQAPQFLPSVPCVFTHMPLQSS
jgi:hypothetical protein